MWLALNADENAARNISKKVWVAVNRPLASSREG